MHRPSPVSRVVAPAAAAASLLAIATALPGCVGGAGNPAAPHLDIRIPEGPVPWTGVAPLEEPGDFHFVIVTDRTGEHRPGVFESAMPKVDLLKPAFVMSVGDLIEGYSENRAELEAQWNEFAGFIERLSMPFFYLPGNHDMSNRVMGEMWRERFGPTFYHFRYKDVLFLALNSELFNMVGRREPVQGVESPAEQMAFVERVLAENADARWTLVFIHQPLWDAPAGRIHPDWLRVEELLGTRPYTVFAGHLHAYTKERRNDRSYITLGTTGGGSGLRGTPFGEFDHVALVTMKPDGPVIANLMLDGIQGEDVRTKPMRSVVRQLEHAVRLAPERYAGDRFRSGEVRLRLANGGTTPLSIVGDLEGSADLGVGADASAAPGSQHIERELAPGQTVEVPVELRARQPGGVPFASFEPVRAHWKLRQTTADGEPIEIESDTLVFPGNAFPVPLPQRPIRVDGSLEEWGALRFDVSQPWHVEHGDHHGGPADASFTFDVRQANDALYLAFDVIDDSLVLSESEVARRQDGLAVTVDARLDPARSSVGSGFFEAIMDGTFSKLVVLDALPVEPAFDAVFSSFVTPVSASIQIESIRTARGYSVEMEIPFLELEVRAGGPWEGVRLEISLRDYDKGEPGHTILWWRPSRFGSLAGEGTGTFLREAGSAGAGMQSPRPGGHDEHGYAH